ADPHGFAGQYKATIDWGDGGPTSMGTVVAIGDGFDVKGDHTYTQAHNHNVTNEAFTYTIIVTITDAGGTTTKINSITAVSPPPLVAKGVNFAVVGTSSNPLVVGQPVNGIVATFTDPDPRIDPSKYTATITWNDGTTPGFSYGQISYSTGNGFSV